MKGQYTYEKRGLFGAIINDGRPLLKLTAISLIGSGLFAFFLGATGHFLPHDIAYLGMNSKELLSIADSKLVYFMIHDRVSFGGSIIAVGTLYLWLAEFPLRAGQAWSWWTLFVSGVVGFGSFLAYLGYGYLDTWHGVATLVLLPVFGLGMFKSMTLVRPLASIKVLFTKKHTFSPLKSRYGLGRCLLLLTAVGLIFGGVVIMIVGMTSVFVPQDLMYMELAASEIESINSRLVPLIAHDRAGFGGGLCACGITMYFCVSNGTPSRSLWQALFITGTFGFGSAIGVHFLIGYTNFFHLSPAYLGAIMFYSGIFLSYKRMMFPTQHRKTHKRDIASAVELDPHS